MIYAVQVKNCILPFYWVFFRVTLDVNYRLMQVAEGIVPTEIVKYRINECMKVLRSPNFEIPEPLSWLRNCQEHLDKLALKNHVSRCVFYTKLCPALVIAKYTALESALRELSPSAFLTPASLFNNEHYDMDCFEAEMFIEFMCNDHLQIAKAAVLASWLGMEVDVYRFFDECPLPDNSLILPWHEAWSEFQKLTLDGHFEADPKLAIDVAYMSID